MAVQAPGVEGDEAAVAPAGDVGDDAVGVEERVARPAFAVVEGGDDEPFRFGAHHSPVVRRACRDGGVLQVFDGGVDGLGVDGVEGGPQLVATDRPQKRVALRRPEHEVPSGLGRRAPPALPERVHLGDRDEPAVVAGADPVGAAVAEQEPLRHGRGGGAGGLEFDETVPGLGGAGQGAPGGGGLQLGPGPFPGGQPVAHGPGGDLQLGGDPGDVQPLAGTVPTTR